MWVFIVQIRIKNIVCIVFLFAVVFACVFYPTSYTASILFTFNMCSLCVSSLVFLRSRSARSKDLHGGFFIFSATYVFCVFFASNVVNGVNPPPVISSALINKIWGPSYGVIESIEVGTRGENVFSDISALQATSAGAAWPGQTSPTPQDSVHVLNRRRISHSLFAIFFGFFGSACSRLFGFGSDPRNFSEMP